MPINTIDAPAALDLRQRENTGSLKSRQPTVPAPAVAPPPDAPKTPVQTVPQQPLAPSMNLKFSRDEKTGKNVVAVIDPVDGRVLRQMPSNEALKVAEAIGRFQGMFVNRKV